jgi:hypothetical protein
MEVGRNIRKERSSASPGNCLGTQLRLRVDPRTRRLPRRAIAPSVEGRRTVQDCGTYEQPVLVPQSRQV